MVTFQGATVNMSSGTTLGVYVPIDRVSDVSFDYTVSRVNVTNLNRFKPLDLRPVINYVPVAMTVNYYKGDKNVERCLGILNPTGIAIQIGSHSKVTDYGCRTYPIYISPASLGVNMGEFDIASGVLKSFSLQGSISDPIRASFTVEGLDLQQYTNNNPRTIPVYSGQVVRPQDVVLTGINFTGFGYSGLDVQSFSFSTTFDYTSALYMGNQFPTRRIDNGNVVLQIAAYIDGTSVPVPSLTGYYPGSYITGQYVLTMNAGCNPTDTPTVITLTNPYLDSQSVSAPVGDLIKVTMSFSVPLTTVASETLVGSNATIT